MIGKPRGKTGTYPVYRYDAEKGKKVYVGCRPTYNEALILQGEAIKDAGTRKPEGSTYTVESYAERFLEVNHTARHGRGEPTTKQQNKGMLKPFLEKYGDRLLSSITKVEANDWATLKPASCKTVKAMFADAAREDAIPMDPFALVRFPKSKGRAEIDPLTEAEVEKLADIAIKAGGTFAPELWSLIQFMAWTGLRPGEVCALDWADVNLETDTLQVRASRRNDGVVGPVKTKYQRPVVIAAKAREALVSLPRRSGPVFRSPTGKPLRPNSLRHYWIPVRDGFTSQLPESHWLRRRLIADPTDRLDPYELRHFCGSILADRGRTVDDIAEHLGNSPLVCRVYIHPHRERVQQRLRDAFAQEANTGASPTETTVDTGQVA